MALSFSDQPPAAQSAKVSKVDVGPIVKELKAHPGKWACVQSDARSPERWVNPLKQHTDIVTACRPGKEAPRRYGEGTVRLTDVWASYQPGK